ncbi:MAG: UDP-N-acetylglucosamine 1-carboxyvinyltransferase [Planctomycetaceae bacterium]
MEMFVVHGRTRLSGRIGVEGAKNAALPIMAACVAIRGEVVLDNVPRLVDIDTMSRLLKSLGTTVASSGDGTLTIDASPAHGTLAKYDLVRRMRAGVCVLGPLLSRFGTACVSLPGGCNIGHRPIDLHLKGLAALGADIRLERGYVIAEADHLRGTDIDLCGPFGSTVTGTCNVMTAAATASGHTVIRSAAREPEVTDLADFLNRAGADIRGAGTETIEVRGVESLHATSHSIIPDRIEAATLAVAAAITRGDVTIESAPVSHMTSVLDWLKSAGVDVAASASQLRVSANDALSPVDVVAEPYPGIPTDVQAQLMALLSTVPGRSCVTDRIFTDRFMHASELIRMGAQIQRESSSAVISGVPRLSAASVMASDLRASAALVLAALAAEGTSQIRRIYHLDRGYQQLDVKLNALGASIVRRDDSPAASDQTSPAIAAPHFVSEHVKRYF